MRRYEQGSRETKAGKKTQNKEVREEREREREMGDERRNAIKYATQAEF
jgi:hypothetical protein